MSYITPVDGPISQYFGSNPAPYQPGGHTGVDYAIPTGTPVRAVGSGVVRHADWASKLGWPNPYYVAIDFDGPANGDQSAGIVVIIDHGPHVSIYAHLNETHLNPGDKVNQGDIIGKSGNTGRSSGPHLHFEMLPDGWNVHNSVYGRIDPLPLLTGPAVPSIAPHQRITAAPANQRSAPNRNATVIKTWDSDVILDFKGWVHGEDVDGNSGWFVGAYSDTYFWSGAFTVPTTEGLPNLDPKPTPAPAPAPAPQPAPTPAPAPAPVVDKYTFAPAFDFVEVIPAALNNFQRGNFPSSPTHAIVHQFGTPGVDTLKSVINTFTNNGLQRVASSHFVVSGDRIIQMVSLDDRAYHAGPVGNSFVGIETDPAQDPATIASTRKLLAALNAKYGHVLELTLHKNVQGNSTSCGSLIDLEKYKVEVPVAPVPAPAPAPVPADKEKTIREFLEWQLAQYLKR